MCVIICSNNETMEMFELAPLTVGESLRLEVLTCTSLDSLMEITARFEQEKQKGLSMYDTNRIAFAISDKIPKIITVDTYRYAVLLGLPLG